MNKTGKSTAVLIEVKGGERVGAWTVAWEGPWNSCQYKWETVKMDCMTCMDPFGFNIPDEIVKGLSVSLEKNEDQLRAL